MEWDNIQLHLESIQVVIIIACVFMFGIKFVSYTAKAINLGYPDFTIYLIWQYKIFTK